MDDAVVGNVESCIPNALEDGTDGKSTVATMNGSTLAVVETMFELAVDGLLREPEALAVSVSARIPGGPVFTVVGGEADGN